MCNVLDLSCGSTSLRSGVLFARERGRVSGRRKKKRKAFFPLRPSVPNKYLQNPGHEHHGETLIPAIPWSVNHFKLKHYCLCQRNLYNEMERKIWPHLIKNKTQTAVINIVNFRIFINLTFRMLFKIHFQK